MRSTSRHLLVGQLLRTVRAALAMTTDQLPRLLTRVTITSGANVQCMVYAHRALSYHLLGLNYLRFQPARIR